MGKAGEKLYLSQPAVVYRLNRMEEEFGTQLFIRSNRGVQFTAAGQKLFSHAGEMLRRHNDIAQEIRLFGKGLSGNITVGSSSTFLSRFLPGQLKSFYEQYPLIAVSLVAKRNDELIEMLNAGQLSVAIVRGEHAWSGASVHLYDDPFVAICSRPCRLEELRDIPFIPYSGDPELMDSLREWGRRVFRRPFITTTDATRVSGPQVCVDLVRADLGWSVVPLTRVIGLTGLFILPIEEGLAKPLARSTRLLYTHEIERVETYAAYIRHFCAYFADFAFPTAESAADFTA